MPSVFQDNGGLSIDENSGTTSGSSYILPYIVGMLYIKGLVDSQSAGLEGNCSMLLGSKIETTHDGTEYFTPWNDVCYYVTQSWVSDLFRYFFEEDPDGNVAVAVQSIITTMAGLAYYDALPAFDKNATIAQTTWVLHNTPGGAFGFRRNLIPAGFIAVACIVAYHLLVVLAIFRLFMAHSKLSRLGDPWQAIAHVASSQDIQPLLDSSLPVTAKRQTVPGNLQSGRNTCVGLSPYDDGKVTLQRLHPE